jgi:sugar lactone lactonase YvrE
MVADAQIAFASGLGSPQGIAISNRGVVYVADTANNRVVRISNAGVVTQVNTTGYTLNSPGAGAVDASGISISPTQTTLAFWRLSSAEV